MCKRRGPATEATWHAAGTVNIYWLIGWLLDNNHEYYYSLQLKDVRAMNATIFKT